MKYIYYLILATVSTTFLIYFLQRTNFFKEKLATADEFVLGKSKKKKI